jgi:hypothetical protein
MTDSVRINVTSRRVRVIIFAVEKQYYVFWVYVCNLSYPECIARAPYYIVIFGLSVFTIFYHIFS